MLIGHVDTRGAGPADAAALRRALPGAPPDAVRAHGPAAVGWHSRLRSRAFAANAAAASKDGRLLAVASGRPTEPGRLARDLGLGERGARASLSELVLALYQRHGEQGVAHLDGSFALAVWDAAHARLLLASDPLGVETLYYACADGRVAFASTLPLLLRSGLVGRGLHAPALARCLAFNYNPDPETLVEGVTRLPGGHRLCADVRGVELERTWRLSFADPLAADADAIAERLREQLRRAVRERIDADDPPGVFVSGGMDSSSVLGLVHETGASPLRTWSYRCAGDGLDESGFAKLMAESVGARHMLVEYRPEDALRMPELAAEMSEPFCDVGINVATWLLGEAAGGDAASVLTGDGGDELFGGHPVYAADRAARPLDLLPAPLRRVLLSPFRLLGDSERKKDLRVMLKRFAESAVLPAGLLSHRWRTYYTPVELRALLTPSLADAARPERVYDRMLGLAAEADGPDLLSRCLYSDTLSVVDFYLRRNDLVRRFGVEVRVPLLDPQLVAFCARIPSGMKIRGASDSKWIQRHAMEPLLPHAIVHREDKLGHSIPLKNWLRDHPDVRALVLDHLDEASLRRRGLFRPDVVRRLWDDHVARRRNNSHRLWALAVVEMWLRAHLDA